MTAIEPVPGPGVPFELPEELAIDTAVARRVIAEFIRGQLEQAGFERAVLGLSGGIDSALVAYLVAEAIGADRLLAVMLPYRTSSPASRADAESVVAALGCRHDVVDITAMVDGYFGTGTTPGAEGPDSPVAGPLRRGNFAARMRMTVLYDRSVTWGGLVVGTGNKTESLIGYTTVFGDAACAFNPIGDLYKSQVRQLAVALGVPDAIVRKAPSADLWPGQTDENEAGLQLPGPRSAAVLAGRQAALGRGAGRARLRCGDGRTSRPDGRAQVQATRPSRSPSSARGRRASTTSTRDGGRDPRASDDTGGQRRDPVRRGHADREPGRRHPAGAPDPARRPAHRRGGHAAHAPIARRHASRPGRPATTRGATRGGRSRCSSTCAAARPRPRHRRRHARSATRERARHRVGRGRWPGRAHPGASAVARRGHRGGVAGHAGVRGVPATVRHGNDTSDWRGSPPTTAGTILYEAPGRLAGHAA